MKKKKSKKSLKNTTLKKNPKKKKEAKKIKHQITLKKARNEDFLELDKYITKNGKKTKKWKFRLGVPYWCVNKKGVIENNNYITEESTDLDNFRELMECNQILVLTNRFTKK